VRKSIYFLTLVLALPLLFSNQAQSLSFDLNYTIGNTTPVTPHSSFGTVVLTDNTTNTNRVNISVDLLNASWKILAVYLNYNDAIFRNSSPFRTTSGKAVGVDENDQEPGSYAYRFDLQIPRNGNINLLDQYNDVIYISGFNLNPEHFAFLDTGGLLNVAVHIGNYNVGGIDSIWVGGGPVANPVPEPATMFLLGSGLIGLAGFARKKFKK
jgi:hypothetical protein